MSTIGRRGTVLLCFLFLLLFTKKEQKVDRKKKLTHGTLEGYKSFGCRCKKCREVWDLYTTQYREEIFDERKAKYKPIKMNIPDAAYSEKPERGYGKL